MLEPTVTVFSLNALDRNVEEFKKNQTYQNLDIVSFEENDTYDDLVSYIMNMNTDYFCFLENNHVYDSEKTKKMLEKMLLSPGIDICACLRQTKDSNMQSISLVDRLHISNLNKGLYRSNQVLEFSINEGINYYGNLSCMMVSRQYAQEIDWISIQGKYEETKKTSLLYQLLGGEGELSYLTEELVTSIVKEKGERDLEKEYTLLVDDFVARGLIPAAYKKPNYEHEKCDVKKEMTFFYTDRGEYYNLEPIEKEARRRGYNTKFTEDTDEKAEIGVYCQHCCKPENSKFSLILLHDMTQGHNRWPNIWELERWDKFDIGIVPGNNWRDLWETCANHYYVNPRRGAYAFGYPKSDYVKSKDLEKKALELRNQMKMKYNFSVLYAPSWENDEKEDDFVRALASLPINLIIKQASWPKAYQFVIDDINRMRELHEGKYENVHYIEPEESIMTALSLCDMVVSDESSVMVEALMFGKPSVAVYDWLIPDTDPKRFASVPMEDIIKCKKVELREIVEKLSTNQDFYKESVKCSEDLFVNKGMVNKLIMDCIDYYVDSGEDESFKKYKMESKYEVQSLWN